MIAAENISKTYRRKGGRRLILRDLSFDVPEFTNFAILGGQGSGKSTLVKLIGGLDFPDRGKIRRRGSMSWPFGQMRYEPRMSVSQNLRFLCRVLGEHDCDRVIKYVADLTGFDSQLHNSVGMLRQQEQRQLNLAISLAFSFDILLLDGKPGFLNLNNGEAIEQEFEDRKAKCAVILATNNPQEISRDYPYILVLGDQTGRLYRKRRDAIQAFRAMHNNSLPESGTEPDS